MSERRVVIRGRTYVTLEAVAECYRVEVSWVREVYEYGLLGSGESVRDTTAVAAEMLGRAADILRLHRQQGINLEGIARLLREVDELESS